MNPLQLSRPLARLAGAAALLLVATAAAQAFTFTDQQGGSSGAATRFADPAERAKSRMTGDNADDRSTIRDGSTSLQFGGRGTFNERNNGDRYFNPNNLMGR